MNISITISTNPYIKISQIKHLSKTLPMLGTRSRAFADSTSFDQSLDILSPNTDDLCSVNGSVKSSSSKSRFLPILKTLNVYLPN